MGEYNPDCRTHTLYHGTSALLNPGDMVLPGVQVGDTKRKVPLNEAWATENIDIAGRYGPNIYHVEYVTEPDHGVEDWYLTLNAGNNIYSSATGFKVLAQVR